MKKVLISIFIIVIVVIICLLVKLLFFNPTVPTGDQNGKFLTNYSSKDMLGNWSININKNQLDKKINKSTGTMNITSLSGSYFYGTITIDESTINKKIIRGGTVEIEGCVYNDIVVIYFDSNEEYLNITYNVSFTPKISNKYMVLESSESIKEENTTYEYNFNLTKMEVYNNEK